MGLGPLLMVFVGHFFFKDRARWYHWLFGALAFAGVAVPKQAAASACGAACLSCSPDCCLPISGGRHKR